MASRFDWTGAGIVVVIGVLAVTLTAWQVRVDRSVVERFFGALLPTAVMVGAAIVGVVALAYLQGTSDFAVTGPGTWTEAVSIIAWAVPLLAAAAIGADLWRFGFVWMLGFRLADYSLWHVAWGVARLELLF